MSIERVFIQGNDAKMQLWTAHFERPVQSFTTWRHLAEILFCAQRGDVVIFRYQNNPARLATTLLETALILGILVKTRVLATRLVWICHNVDQDTSPHFKPIERLRRRALMRMADLVLVLDPAFLRHVQRPDARAISFGAKQGGHTSEENRAAVVRFAAKQERTVLIAGSDGGKYKAFARIPELISLFAELGINAGVVTAGMDPARRFSPEIETRVLRIQEPDIRESDISAEIDYVYRENDDISMPYTVYAAATAGIPILTRADNVLAGILHRERIGLTLEDLPAEDARYDFEGFLDRHGWDSLARVLREAGISA